MPGPGGSGSGGGSHSGGFSGGGSHGGGFSGGGRHGGGFSGGHSYYGGPIHTSTYYGPRRVGGGRGCGGCAGGCFTAVFVLFFIAVIIITSFGGGEWVETENGWTWTSKSDTSAIQDYAYDEYIDIFGETEEAALVVLLIPEDYEDYYIQTMIGDYLDSTVHAFFSEDFCPIFEAEMSGGDGSTYKYLICGAVQRTMEASTEQMKSSSAKYHDGYRGSVTSAVRNKAGVPMTTEQKNGIDTSLQAFTEQTGVPVVFLIEKAEKVVPSAMPSDTEPAENTFTILGFTLPLDKIFPIAICGIIAVVALILVVKYIRKKKDENDDVRRGNVPPQYTGQSQANGENITGGRSDSDVWR